MSNTDTENKQAERVETAPGQENGQEGQAHDHNHEGHEHTHGPVLNPECTRELAIDVAAEDVTAAFKRVTAQYRRYAKIPGFRPGKVPESVVRRKFATDIRKEVIDTLLPARFNQGVRELGIRPVGQPQVTELSVEDGAPFHVKAVFEYIPDFSIEGYKDVTVEKPKAEVTEEEYQAEIEALRDSRSTMEPVEEDRALADGDWAEIAYKGQVEGAAEDEAEIESSDALLEVGGKHTIEAFTVALRGAKAGQEIRAEVTYPADYGESRFAGKTVTYDITVKGIKKRIMPDLNDDFAKELGDFESLAELEKQVRERLEKRKRRAAESDGKDKLMLAIADKYRFAVPESLVQEQIDNRLERGLRALAAQGMTPDVMRQMDFGRLRTAQRDGALSDVKIQILLDRIAAEENLDVTGEELERELQIIAVQSREPLDALKGRLNEDGGMARLRDQIRREKMAAALYERLPG